MNKRITKGYVNHYSTVKFMQQLPSGRRIYVTYSKTVDNMWYPTYSTDSIYHMCPHDGRVINCKDCSAYSEDVEEMLKNCISHKKYITSTEMAARATDCLNAANCTVEFLGF